MFHFMSGLFTWDFSIESPQKHVWLHGLRTPNEGINQRNLKFWADIADFGRT